MSYPLAAAGYLIPPTSWSFAIIKRVEEEFAARGFQLIKLHGPLANRYTFLWTLAMYPEIPLVIYGGHGEVDRLCGESYTCDMLTVKDVRFLKGKIVVACPACLTARQLGPAAVAAGAKAWLGSVSYMYAQFPEAEHNYFADWVDYTLQLYRALIEGRTVLEALEAYQAKGSQYLKLYYENLQRWPNADWNYQAAWKNLRYFTVLGDTSAKVDLKKYQRYDIWSSLSSAISAVLGSFIK